MNVSFSKMQAQGNDFVILNGLATPLPELDVKRVRAITERRYGIGCDQLLVIVPSDRADALMRIFNSDGTEAANCGNGLRCVGALLMRELGKDSVSIELADRIVHASKSTNGIRVEMGAARIEGSTAAHVDVSVGNPHSVFFEAIEGFPEDRNIEIVTGQAGDHVWIDIIERGAGRTLACGSGACATAAAIWHAEGHARPQTIEMPGGIVTVSGSMQQLILEGPVSFVYAGKFDSEALVELA
ncbi:MAG TPA: diaminopimelate epimerase [Mariprofundaceae bacterium]|nr:diaminopimelate epimerase [Mariprofundaceae bacterium]